MANGRDDREEPEETNAARRFRQVGIGILGVLFLIAVWMGHNDVRPQGSWNPPRQDAGASDAQLDGKPPG